jgi:hypothetical protein
MIGLALVTTVLVVGTSLKSTFKSTIDKTITADWYVVPKSFVGFDPALTAPMTDLPEPRPSPRYATPGADRRLHQAGERGPTR